MPGRWTVRSPDRRTVLEVYGEKSEQALTRTGIACQTLKNYA